MKPGKARSTLKVVLLSASSGAGHVRAAEAIEKAWRIARPGDDVAHLDILKYSSSLMRRLYTKTYFDFAKSAPELLGWAYRRTDRPWKHMRRRTAFDRLNLNPLIRELERRQPDLIACTHFTAAEVVSWLKAKGKIRCPQAVVVTDFDAHGMWMVPTCEKYLVAREETLEYLVSQGVVRKKVAVTGIPIDPVFARRLDRNAMRRRHKLKARGPVLLVSAGGFGTANVEPVVKGLLRMKSKAQIVMVCGRNAQLKKRLAWMARSAGAGSRLRVLGFTKELDQLMAAADILIGKPGGLTSSEALARGLPMAIVNPIPGQEERNADYLLEEGAAVRLNNLSAVGWKMDSLLRDRWRLASMRAAAARMGRPRSAFSAVREIAALQGRR